MYLQKMRKRNKIPADARQFLRKEIDSTDFENEHLTANIRRNTAEKSFFLKKIFQKILKQTKLSNKKST